MKKNTIYIVVFILLIVISLFFYNFARQTVRKLASPIPSIEPIPTETLPTRPPATEFKFGDRTYQFYFHKILKNETLELIPNFENATFSAQIVKENKCDFGINGGLYMTNREPLGLFQIGTKLIGARIKSTTFNGLFEKKDGVFGIFPSQSNLATYKSTDFVLQSGPVFYLDPQIPAVTKEIYVDKDFARRSLIAMDVDQNFYLFSIFEKDNVLNGPKLEDIHDMLLSPEFKKIANFETAINMDGGSASAFYDKNVQVEEFMPIGSFLCGKKK